MTRFLLLALVAAAPGFAETTATQFASGMLAQVKKVDWGQPFAVSPKSTAAPCTKRGVPAQMDIYATSQWTHHCQASADGLIRETFYYVFGEPIRTANLRLDLRPENESPQFTAELLPVLEAELTKRFGAPNTPPEMIEIGIHRIRHGQAIAGDHWHSGAVHYFLHANLAGIAPSGVRRGVQLIVIHDRLYQERLKDETILKAEGSAFMPTDANPMQARLAALVGPAFMKAVKSTLNSPAEMQEFAKVLAKDTLQVLRDAVGQANDEKPLRLLAADIMVARLAASLTEVSKEGEHEAALAKSVRANLAAYGVKLGGVNHYGGLAYNRDLLNRVWREFPETEAGELAFLELQRRGWSTAAALGCPPNPDYFHEVIAKGEAYLDRHPDTRLRKEILLTIAIAYESLWSIALTPQGDYWTGDRPYPRREQDLKQKEKARKKAIEFYSKLVELAPDSAEAASAQRRLPRLELSIDTGQRRFFCSYC